MILELTEAEREALLTLVEREISDLGPEIRHTTTRTYRDDLKARKQARALFAYNSESVTNQAFWMGFSEIFSDYSWFEGYIDSLESVTPESVISVARKYLLPSNRIVGIYQPVDN